ncbi:MAG: NADPH-dependent F420 reductase [Actinomycetes bacterium]
MNKSIGIIGGSGPAGRGLAVRLASVGYSVVLGSREADRAEQVARALTWRGRGTVTGSTNENAAECDVVILATPWDSAVSTVVPLRKQLVGKVVISMVNALQKQGRELVPMFPARGSMAAEVAAALPGSKVTGAFHHLPAADMENLDSGLDADVMVVGDDIEARTLTVEITDAMEGLRAVEVGSLSLAGAVEAFTAVCITTNIRHKAHTYVKLAGL